MIGLAKIDFEADAVAELADDGMPIIGVNLKVGERLSGLSGQDILRAVVRGDIDARSKDGRIILIYPSLRQYVLGLPRA